MTPLGSFMSAANSRSAERSVRSVPSGSDGGQAGRLRVAGAGNVHTEHHLHPALPAYASTSLP